MKQQMRASAYHLKLSEVKKLTMDMYGTISIDEMQEIAHRKLGE